MLLSNQKYSLVVHMCLKFQLRDTALHGIQAPAVCTPPVFKPWGYGTAVHPGIQAPVVWHPCTPRYASPGGMAPLYTPGIQALGV